MKLGEIKSSTKKVSRKKQYLLVAQKVLPKLSSQCVNALRNSVGKLPLSQSKVLSYHSKEILPIFLQDREDRQCFAAISALTPHKAIGDFR